MRIKFGSIWIQIRFEFNLELDFYPSSNLIWTRSYPHHHANIKNPKFCAISIKGLLSWERVSLGHEVWDGRSLFWHVRLEEIYLLLSERPQIVLGFLDEKKSKRKESSSIFYSSSSIFFWSIFDIKKIWVDRRRRSNQIRHQKPTARASTPIEGWSI